MSTTKSYIKGLFANKVTTKYGEMINIDLSEDGIKALQALPANEKGYRKITLGAQKNDASKLSAWENDFVPTKKNGSDPSPKTPSQNIEPTEGDDLPF
jgi:hypothetical protein